MSKLWLWVFCVVGLAVFAGGLAYLLVVKVLPS